MWHTVNNEKRQKSTWRRSRFYESRKHQSDSHCKSGWNDRPIGLRSMTVVAVLMLGAFLTRTLRAGCAVCDELAIKVPCKYPDKVASQFPLNPD